MKPDDLTSLKDDMTAFIEGHGMRRFRSYVSEDVTSVMWDAGGNPENWKDFVEIAKASGAPFLTMNAVTLKREDIEYLIESLRSAPYANDEDFEEARALHSFVGRTGFVQIGWPYQGVLFLYESSTDWYERYQRLLDLIEECGGLTLDIDPDDER
jgi:hypothetical protein